MDRRLELPEEIGSLDLRAVVRLALRAHGFRLAPGELERAVDERWKRGCELRDQVLPRLVPPLVDRERYEAGVRHGAISTHLPHMLGFGAAQAEVLGSLFDRSTAHAPLAVAASAAFSAGIAVLDYLADELLDPAELFRALDGPVRALLDRDDTADRALADAAARANDPRQEVLFALVGLCRHAFLELHARSGNTAALRSLGAVMAEMYAAERALATNAGDSAHAEAKSVLPFVAVARILALAHPPPVSTAAAEAAAQTLGRIVMLTDDLVDLADDWTRGTPTAAVRRVAAIVEQRRGDAAGDADVYEAIDRTAAEIVALIDGDASIADLARTTVGGWVRWRDDRPERPAGTAPADPAIDRAAAALLAEQQSGYPEAVHHLSLPRLGSGARGVEVRPALVFQRGVILDALLDAEDRIGDAAIAREAMAILLAKHRGVRGGWNYIPEVPELPPDLDDLGMALQVLYRAGGRALAAVCDRAVRLATASDDFSTWIFDERDRSDLAQRMRAYVELTRSAGAHPEVVANFLHALRISDAERHEAVLRRGCTFLAATQEADGHWRSRWYAGPHYGTWRAVAVLAACGRETDAVRRALQFIEATQEAGGGWSDGDPLQSAFALLSLGSVRDRNDEAVIRGVEFLRRQQEPGGTWRPAPFIEFPFPGTNHSETYASRTITTAFCLKALRLFTFVNCEPR